MTAEISTVVEPRPAGAAGAPRTAAGRWLLGIPLAFTLALAALAWLPSIAQSRPLFWSLTGAALVLTAGLLGVSLRFRRHAPRVEIVLRPQHYLQACAQGTVLLYWGWYWRPVYEAAPLLVAQLLFAYAFDMLLAWARRDDYTLGFAPFPVIFSTNLFLWFRADWFYLQFLMIAVGFAAKELIRWERDGRRVHIFNPSSFPLAVFSLVLLATGTTYMTWGPEIATTQFNPPNIYVLLFLVGLPGQLLFGVTTMTMSAVLTTYAFSLLYYLATGSFFFIDSYIPIAVFLGMHLLFTDPSTSPRTEGGRIVFGIMYGLGNVILYELLSRAGMPTFYDKLLPVPIMNLSVRLIDSVVRRGWLSWLDPSRIVGPLPRLRRHAAYVAVWSAVFVTLHATGGVGDDHPGHTVKFWESACESGARQGCENLGLILDTHCAGGSAWACNEAGVLRVSRKVGDAAAASAFFARACGAGFRPACNNAISLRTQAGPATQEGPPRVADYPIILRTGKGGQSAQPNAEPVVVLASACDQGWGSACDELGGMYLQDQALRDPVKAQAALERACELGWGMGCSNLGYMHYTGDGIPKDEAKGLEYLKRACGMKYDRACTWLKDFQR